MQKKKKLSVHIVSRFIYPELSVLTVSIRQVTTRELMHSENSLQTLTGPQSAQLLH